MLKFRKKIKTLSPRERERERERETNVRDGKAIEDTRDKKIRMPKPEQRKVN